MPPFRLHRGVATRAQPASERPSWRPRAGRRYVAGGGVIEVLARARRQPQEASQADRNGDRLHDGERTAPENKTGDDQPERQRGDNDARDRIAGKQSLVEHKGDSSGRNVNQTRESDLRIGINEPERQHSERADERRPPQNEKPRNDNGRGLGAVRASLEKIRANVRRRGQHADSTKAGDKADREPDTVVVRDEQRAGE